MNQIKITYKIIDHPYQEEFNRTVYGMINAKLVDEKNKTIMVLTNQVWDLLQYFGWYVENCIALLNQKLPKFFPKGHSIAERVRMFLFQNIEWETAEENRQYDIYYDYSQSHDFFKNLSGSAGSDIKFSRSIYIGKLDNGYQISMYAEEDKKRKIEYEHWMYEFDLPELISFAKNEYYKIINSPKGHNEINLKKYFSL